MAPFIALSDDSKFALRFAVCHGSEFSSVDLRNYEQSVQAKGWDYDSKLATIVLSQILSKPICMSVFLSVFNTSIRLDFLNDIARVSKK